MAAAPTDGTTTAGGGKQKAGSDANKDDSSAASLAFISQSIAAAIAGAQPPSPQAQVTTANGVSASPDDEAATESVSALGGSAVQNMASTLVKGTADALPGSASSVSDSTSGLKADASANAAPGADGSGSAVSAFQAQMSVASHLQQPSATDNDAGRINAPVGSPAFNDELGGKITWMAHRAVQSASVQLSPDNLGPVHVHISVQDGSATVSFNAAHPETRAALEQALPHLRAMFATQGLTLSDASVSHQPPRERAPQQPAAALGASGGVGDDTTSSSVTSVLSRRLGLVDTYV